MPVGMPGGMIRCRYDVGTKPYAVDIACCRYGMLSIWHDVGTKPYAVDMTCCRYACRYDVLSVCPSSGGAAHAAGVRPGDNVVGVNGRIPLGYTQVMGTLPTAPRPVRIRFIR